MSDKKIIDDYYSQNTNSSNDSTNLDKKPKFSIKWKIKVKKEPSSNEKEDVLLDKEIIKPEITKAKVIKEVVEKKNKEVVEKKIKVVKEVVKKKSEEKKVITEVKKIVTAKTDINIPISAIPKIPMKKEYFTQKWIEKNAKNNETKKTFIRDRNNIKDRTFNKVIKKDVKDVKDNKDNKIGEKPNFVKKEVWSYTTAHFKPTQDFSNVPNNKFVKKWVKKFDEKEETKKPKFFKKDKINKHWKNISFESEEDLSFSRSNKIKKQEKVEKKVEDIKQNLTNRSWETVIIWDILSVKELSEKIWVPLIKLITEFMKNWMKVTINSKIDFDTASIITEIFDVKIQKDISSWFEVEDLLSWNLQALLWDENKDELETRAPVISIMWHVDHGKTSLLDYIRKTKIADKEAGWITQSIWAYQVEYKNKKITFLDTPWHEAFTVMRARWAKSTDIAILVVARDEWVKPQTIESINHAREAWIPIAVAINKMDKPWANIDFVKWQLAQNWLQSEDWGWDIPMVPVSAKEWTWIDELLEIILILSEMQELKANPKRLAIWTVLESHLDMKLWPVASILINTWTLHKWDSIVCRWSYWKVKLLKDHYSKNIVVATPSMPVLVIWLDSVVEWGDIIQVVSDIEKARIKALEYKELMSSKKSSWKSSIDMIMSKIKSWNLKQLKIVLKSDTNWSLEAIKWALIKLSTPETKINIIHSWVWNITEWDVLMCQWSQAVLIWFNVIPLWTSKNLINDTKVEYISSKIIYHITERIEKIVTWMLDTKEVEVLLWEAVIWWIFYVGEWFLIVWLKLKINNKIQKNAQMRIIRKDKMIWKWLIENLKSWILDVNDIEWPTECWIRLKTDVKIEMWDILEIFKTEIQK